MRKGRREGFSRREFEENDLMYVVFERGVDGYVGVYVMDERGRGYWLVGYENERDGEEIVKEGKE